MIWMVTGLTFLVCVLVVSAVAYAFTSKQQPVGERLTQLWNPATAAAQVTFREKQKKRAQKVLKDVGKLIPTSTKQLSYTRRLLVRAGYRRPEAAMAMQGAKVLVPAGLIALAYFTQAYAFNAMLVFGAAALVGFLLPGLWLTWRVKRRQHRLRLSLPDALDLMVVCVEAGLGLDQAILRVAQELKIAHPELSIEFQLVNLEMRAGKTRLESLREFAARTGVDDIKALVAMLIQTDRFGTSIARSLRVHSDNLRTKRRQQAEEAAAKTTVKMVPPLVFFIFPALFVVILGPAVILVVRHLFPVLEK